MKYTPADAMRDAADLKSLPVLDELYALDDAENSLLWEILNVVTGDMKAMRWVTHGTPQQMGTYYDLVAVRMDLTTIMEERRYDTR